MSSKDKSETKAEAKKADAKSTNTSPKAAPAVDNSHKIVEIEEAIKLALGAADAATNIAGEFNKIVQDYDKFEKGGKKLLRIAAGMFISAAIATGGSLTFAAMIHNRTMTEMQTANNTSLEALVVFAENIEKLKEVTQEAQTTLARQTEVEAAALAAKEAAEKSAETLGTTKAELHAEMVARLDEQMTALDAYLDAASGRIDGALAEQVAVLDAALTPMAATIEKLRNQEKLILDETPVEDGNPVMAPVTLDLLDQKLETMMLLQKELSAKLTVVQKTASTTIKAAAPTTTARKTTYQPKSKPKPDQNLITYP